MNRESPPGRVVATALVLATFVDDAARIATDYQGQVDTLHTLARAKPHLNQTHKLLPALFLVTQVAGVALILSGKKPQAGCLLLIAWTAAQPFIFEQYENLEFVLRSLTIIGGMLILLADQRTLALKVTHFQGSTSKYSQFTPAELKENVSKEKNRLLFVGRILLVSIFMYYAAKTSHGRLLDGTGLQELSGVISTVAHALLFLALLAVTALIVIGLKSRYISGFLAGILICAAMVRYPWYITIWGGGRRQLTYVVGHENTLVDNWLYADHQRYFFFQQLSSAGALLQLVHLGPGSYSIDSNEMSIAVRRV